MSDNVLILGAGFSADAGIPLIGGFVERMLEYYRRGMVNGRPILPEQKEIISKALKIRDELDNYHGRAIFNDRNIEDILSILAFNVLGGGTAEQEKLTAMNQAIATTIELSCNLPTVNFPDLITGEYTLNETGDGRYRDFWLLLFKRAIDGKALPEIITLNYDLVLERSLFQVLNGIHITDKRYFPKNGIILNYQYGPSSKFHYKLRNCQWQVQSGISKYQITDGTTCQPCQADDPTNDFLEIKIFKLHGSLNFPQKIPKGDGHVNPTVNVNKPYIIPPISNKASSIKGDTIWKGALNALRKAKNIIFIGYSLPRTDIYMQYFLKAGIGPNKEIDKIFVFDPNAIQLPSGPNEMQERYKECFAEQLRPRIIFPTMDVYSGKTGKFHSFVKILKESPGQVLF